MAIVKIKVKDKKSKIKIKAATPEKAMQQVQRLASSAQKATLAARQALIAQSRTQG